MTTTEDKPQTNELYGPNLILDVENFGPIAEAKNIEFKPMTVFVGKSNTGKTYLAVLLHALLKARLRINSLEAFNDAVQRGDVHVFEDHRIADLRRECHPSKAVRTDGFSPRRGAALHEFPVSKLTEVARSLLEDATKLYLTHFLTESSNSIRGVFDVNDILELSSRPGRRSTPLKIDLSDTSSSTSLSVVGPMVENLEIPSMFEVLYDQGSDVEDGKNGKHPLDIWLALQSYAESGVGHYPHSHYLKAGRTGLLDAYRELAATLIARAAARSRRETAINPLAVNYATSEFLQYVVLVNSSLDRRRSDLPVAKLSELLEQGVLGGRIRIEESVGVTSFEFDDGHVSVPLDQASSMVTELAPITLFLRCFIDPGDLLIIDEPEAHLHPEAQQQMAAALAFMVRSGLRVLITTHSHYMVEQLSAFVNASKLDETTRKRALSLGGALGEEDIYLNEDETAVYSFRMSPEHGGSVVEEIFMGEEYEYGPDDHSDATVRQFNRSQSVLEARENAEANGLD